jgi:hypothetical protein
MKISAPPTEIIKSPRRAVTRSLKMSMIGFVGWASSRLFRPFCGVTRLALANYVNEDCEGVGEIMIGPPGLPKYGRRVFAFAAPKRSRSRQHQHAWKWVTGLYLAGVLAHFSHHMVGLPDGSNPSSEALTSAPLSLVWPADLIETLITLG